MGLSKLRFRNFIMVTLISLTLVSSFSHAVGCPSLSETSARRREKIVEAYLRGNLRFPQISIGIVVSMVNLYLLEGYTAKEFFTEFSEDEVDRVFNAMKTSHAKISQSEIEASKKRVAQLIRGFQKSTQYALDSIAKKLSDSRLSTMEELEQINPNAYRLALAYAATIHQELLTPEIMALSRAYRNGFDVNYVPHNGPRIYSPEFIRGFEGRIIRALETNHPELKPENSFETDAKDIYWSFTSS